MAYMAWFMEESLRVTSWTRMPNSDSYMAWFMDGSLFGMRVQDVTRSVDYLLSRPDVAKADWKIVGKGAGALWVLYAAALDSRIQDAACERGLISYRDLARTDRYLHNASVFVRDV